MEHYDYRGIDYAAASERHEHSLWRIFGILFVVMVVSTFATVGACVANPACSASVPTLDGLLGGRWTVEELVAGVNKTMWAPQAAHYLVTTFCTGLVTHAVLGTGVYTVSEPGLLRTLTWVLACLMYIVLGVNLAVNSWYIMLVVLVLLLAWMILSLHAIRKRGTGTALLVASVITLMVYTVCAIFYVAFHAASFEIPLVKENAMLASEILLGISIVFFMILHAIHLGDVRWAIWTDYLRA